VVTLLSAGAARQPLFSVILSLSIYVCLLADFRHCKALGNYLTSGAVHTRVHNILSSAL